jgi:hypothetical protein
MPLSAGCGRRPLGAGASMIFAGDERCIAEYTISGLERLIDSRDSIAVHLSIYQHFGFVLANPQTYVEFGARAGGCQLQRGGACPLERLISPGHGSAPQRIP